MCSLKCTVKWSTVSSAECSLKCNAKCSTKCTRNSLKICQKLSLTTSHNWTISDWCGATICVVVFAPHFGPTLGSPGWNEQVMQLISVWTMKKHVNHMVLLWFTNILPNAWLTCVWLDVSVPSLHNAHAETMCETNFFTHTLFLSLWHYPVVCSIKCRECHKQQFKMQCKMKCKRQHWAQCKKQI